MRGAALAVLLGAVALGACATVAVPPPPGRPGAPRPLPLTEYRAPPAPGRDALAVLLTGDGPIPVLEDRIARALAHGGVPTVAWSSLRYYARRRTPEEAAADLDRVIRSYGARWARRRVVVVGYSYGADVAPFLVNRLPPDTRARVAGVVLLNPAHDALFRFRPGLWFGGAGYADGRAVRPEVERLAGIPGLCVWGRGDARSACPSMATSPLTVVTLEGGHGFSGDRERVARVVAEFAARVSEAWRQRVLTPRRTVLATGPGASPAGWQAHAFTPMGRFRCARSCCSWP